MASTEFKFTLNPTEKQSFLWKKIQQHFTKELDIARRKNDGNQLTAEQTSAIRGEISCLKKLIALDVVEVKEEAEE